MAKDMVKDKELKKTTHTYYGQVVSDKMDKTVVIKVYRTFRHPMLGKTINRFKKYKVHDEQKNAKVGDWVEAVETRPISKTKYMVLEKIVKKAS